MVFKREKLLELRIDRLNEDYIERVNVCGVIINCI